MAATPTPSPGVLNGDCGCARLADFIDEGLRDALDMRCRRRHRHLCSRERLGRARSVTDSERDPSRSSGECRKHGPPRAVVPGHGGSYRGPRPTPDRRQRRHWDTSLPAKDPDSPTPRCSARCRDGRPQNSSGPGQARGEYAAGRQAIKPATNLMCSRGRRYRGCR
jgi:hypothetical protein